MWSISEIIPLVVKRGAERSEAGYLRMTPLLLKGVPQKEIVSSLRSSQ